MLWPLLAALAIATVAVLLYPLLRPASAAPARLAYDLAVYRAQLAEVDADLDRGTVAQEQAEAARLEIQRRMLDASKAGAATPSDDRRARRAAAIVIAVIVPIGAGLIYASRGNPQLPDRPYAERLQHDPAVILANAAAKMEAQLAANPDARGYERLAELYALQHDYEHAAAATKRAILNGANSAANWAQLGETHVLASGGAVAPQALSAFAQALNLDAREPRARFYAGLAEAQIGNLKGAVAIWRDLEKDSKADAPWLPMLRSEMAAAATAGKFDAASVPPAPPSVTALNAAVEAMTMGRN